MKPLTRAEVRAALRKGQGRIVLHLREHGTAPIEDELLEACLHSLAYDAQCEGTRAEWLMELLDLTGNTAFYRDRILEALPGATEFWDVPQLLGLALEFARRGSSQARAALYETFDRQQFHEEWLGGEQIVALDGVAGMLHVAEVVGTRLSGDPEGWVDGSVLSLACEQCGEEPVMAALRARAQDCPAVRAYLDSIASLKARHHAAASAARTVKNVDQILADIEAATGPFRGQFIAFGRTAGALDLERVFDRLLVESRQEQLLRCLWVFRRRALPRLDGRLFALAEGTDRELQEAALAALAASQAGSIRDLGLRLLRTDPETITRGALTLFRKNYAPGDHAAIEAVLVNLEEDGATHGIGFDLLDVAESQPDPELASCLNWVYERTPCSNCRWVALRELLKRERASAEMLREAAWDCAEDTRALAREALHRIG
jgi:hypothetical protein